jgi:hypothetical protein
MYSHDGREGQINLLRIFPQHVLGRLPAILGKLPQAARLAPALQQRGGTGGGGTLWDAHRRHYGKNG